VAKPADKISLLDIISALEGPIILVDCLDKSGSCDRSSSCVTREVWGKIEDNMKQTMSEITLQDLVDKQEARATGQATNYDI
jgi:Rrf2 family protein